MATCRELGCNRDATHTVIVNAPVRGYAEDPACTEHAEKAEGRVYVRDVRPKGGEQGCKHIRRVRIEVGQVDTDALEAQLAETADDLEASAAELESKAQDLTEMATDLRDALDRLEEVSDR